jgi:hypothetical protein
MSIRKYLDQNKKLWIIAVSLVVLIKLFSLNGFWVESFYTSRFYFYFSRILRAIFGWIPFSFGDILYLIAGLWFLYKIIRNVVMLFRKTLNKKIAFRKIFKLLLGLSFVYIIFNIFWGINYNRRGIAYQLNLRQLGYDSSDLKMIQEVLIKKVNDSKVSLIRSNARYPDDTALFERAQMCYLQAQKIYPFLHYSLPSIKSSLYEWWGNYLGFTGYYNPFTGEAQVNTTVPKFLQPSIATHEISHQLGYAKENEANFVGYLASVNSEDTLFHYSAYFELFLYANREMYFMDSTFSRASFEKLRPDVKNDILELRKFNADHKSFVEPAITWLYGKYLKLNQQPQGMRSYNAVIAMLISYYKEYGKI